MVEIEVSAAGLNFHDVVRAAGLLGRFAEEDSRTGFGMECAGTISAVGPGAHHFNKGDGVLAVTHGSLQRFVVTAAEYVVRKPAGMSFESAAAVPVAFMTAWYGLHHVARLKAGETVLVQAAAGGVELAAVRIARHLGAEVLATAGSEEKREFLRSLGITHVFNSRSVAFARELRNVTGGRGVDVVLNSLTGAALSAGLECLRNYGRFVEIGKRDILENSILPLAAFRQSLSFSSVDLDLLFREQRARASALLREVTAMVASNVLEPLPMQTFGIEKCAEAFRCFSQAKHIGKNVITIDAANARIQANPEVTIRFRADATYLITGGLGGLGMATASWMVTHGARHLVLLNRTPPSDAAQRGVSSIEMAGAHVDVHLGDVSESGVVERVVSRIQRTMPPLRGVIHAAGTLDDGVLQNLTWKRFGAVMLPKVQGAWNLHSATIGTPLDFFARNSSAAALLGSPGQGNYSAANAFLDRLACFRVAHGLPGISINWGPWSETGGAAVEGRAHRLETHGIGSIKSEAGLAALGHLLIGASGQVGVVALNPTQLAQAYPSFAHSPLIDGLADGPTGPFKEGKTASDTLHRILAASTEEALTVARQYLLREITHILGAAAHDLDIHQSSQYTGHGLPHVYRAEEPSGG